MNNSYRRAPVIQSTPLRRFGMSGRVAIHYFMNFHICTASDGYDLLRITAAVSDSDYTDDTCSDPLARGLGFKVAILRALQAENQALANDWRMFDQPSVDGAKTLHGAARDMNIAVYDPRQAQRPGDWRPRAAHRGLIVIGR